MHYICVFVSFRFFCLFSFSFCLFFFLVVYLLLFSFYYY